MKSTTDNLSSEQQVEREIGNLIGASRTRLKETWRSLYGKEAPERMSEDHLKRAIAYRLQERAFGGLNAATRRLLERVADEATGYQGKENRSSTKVPAGTLLVREWHGKTHKVTVSENSVVYRDQRYRSLSEVARKITGAHWSGPLFFGLKAAEGREREMEPAKSRFRRCAIYTRKSSEEGLEQNFNSLHAQREACEAFVKSQAGEGWQVVKVAYDDGGLSGGTMERPALQRLLDDIQQGIVDVVVVYKVDRLTRSLADFAKMVEVFDAKGISFVAVTQQFNTTTSMGRLTLNVLLSFAQFEREVTGERIRDKIAASKRKGLWMGGVPPLGYDVVGRSLVINPEEAETVRLIYQQYLELGNVRLLKEHLHRQNIISKVRTSKNGARSGGCAFSRGALYELLANPLYIGEVRHRKERHPGQQEAIIGRELWEQVQQRLRDGAVRRGNASRNGVAVVLAGKLVDEYGERLTPSHTVKRGRHYRYYVSRRLFRSSAAQVKNGRRHSAPELERNVLVAARSMLNDRAGLIESLPNAEPSADQIRSILRAADAATNSLDSQPQEPAVLRDLVDRVELRRDALQLTLDLLPFAGPDHALEDRGQFKITKLIPLQIARHGFEMRLVLGGQAASSPNRDPALLKAVARGFRWFRLLACGEASSAADIARHEKLDKHYVSRLIPLAFLAPSIVEAIADGTHPPHLTTAMLTRGVNLPFQWADQNQLLIQSLDVRQFPKPA